jgi:hypothetical protein
MKMSMVVHIVQHTPTNTTSLSRDNDDDDAEALNITMHLLSNNIEARLFSLCYGAPAIYEYTPGKIRTRHVPISERLVERKCSLKHVVHVRHTRHNPVCKRLIKI